MFIIKLSRLIFALVLLTAVSTFPLIGEAATSTSSVDALKAQQAKLNQEAIDAEQRAKAQKSVAERANDKVEEVTSQIKNLQGNIQSTTQQIGSTQDQINQKNQEAASLQSTLSSLDKKKDVLLRQLYIASVSMPDELALFSNENVSQKEVDAAQFDALKQSVAVLHSKTMAAKQQVEDVRAQLVKKNQDLQNLKDQQDEQQRGLADVKLQQAQLADNAEAAVVSLEAKAQAARIQAAKVESQIEAQLAAILRARQASGAVIGGPGAGRWVEEGEAIGSEGSTGNSTGPHVHFEVRSNGVAVNPQPYVNNGTYRWPLASFVISQTFGYTSYAASGAYGGSIHTGIDLAGPYGETVVAPAAGEVILDQCYGGYGKAVAIQSKNGLVALMGHMIGRC